MLSLSSNVRREPRPPRHASTKGWCSLQQASAMAIKLRQIDQEELACEIDEEVRRAIHYASM
jgi:hypothetical protein